MGDREGRFRPALTSPIGALLWSTPATVDFSSVLDSPWFFSCTGPCMSVHVCACSPLENCYSVINTQFEVSSPLTHYFGPSSMSPLHPRLDHTGLCAHAHHDLLHQALRKGSGQATWLGS